MADARDQLRVQVVSYTCSQNCMGFRGNSGGCCTLDDRDFIPGPVRDADTFLADLGRLLGRDAKQLPEQVAQTLGAYLGAVRAENKPGKLSRYPGSPCIALRLMRRQDTLIANEMHPEEHAKLVATLGRLRRAGVKVMALDGWTALRSLLPPIERRGVILIDPPFEEEADFTRLARSLETAHRKWPGGTYLLWYPIKDREAPDTLARRLRRSGIAKILRAELAITGARVPDRLGACGLIVVNPPWTLERELEVMLPALAAVLSGDRARHCVDWLAGEK